jgi:hypothetical protein
VAAVEILRPLAAAAAWQTAVAAVARRLCRILLAMLRNATDFSVSRTGFGDFKRTGTYNYRLRPNQQAACQLPAKGSMRSLFGRAQYERLTPCLQAKSQETVWGSALRSEMWGINDLKDAWRDRLKNRIKSRSVR